MSVTAPDGAPTAACEDPVMSDRIRLEVAGAVRTVTLTRPEKGNAMDAEEVAVGWWPGDTRYGKAAFYAYAHPARDGFAGADMSPGRWDAALGEYVLDWDEVRASADPHAIALDFARGVFRHACTMCDWDPALGASAEGNPPPLA